jgi:hypothetical protein
MRTFAYAALAALVFCGCKTEPMPDSSKKSKHKSKDQKDLYIVVTPQNPNDDETLLFKNWLQPELQKHFNDKTIHVVAPGDGALSDKNTVLSIYLDFVSGARPDTPQDFQHAQQFGAPLIGVWLRKTSKEDNFQDSLPDVAAAPSVDKKFGEINGKPYFLFIAYYQSAGKAPFIQEWKANTDQVAKLAQEIKISKGIN